MSKNIKLPLDVKCSGETIKNDTFGDIINYGYLFLGNRIMTVVVRLNNRSGSVSLESIVPPDEVSKSIKRMRDPNISFILTELINSKDLVGFNCVFMEPKEIIWCNPKTNLIIEAKIHI